MDSPIRDADALWRVLEVTRSLAVPLELKAMLAQVTAAAREVLRADRVSVLLYDAPRRELYSLVATGVEEIRFSAERGIAGECIRTRQVVNVADCYADPRFNRDIDRCTGYHTHCLMSAPLIGCEERLVGVLQLMNKAGGEFSAEDASLAGVFASQCAVAVQRALLLAEHQAKLKLERDIEVAHEIQTRVLPTEMPQLPDIDMAPWSRPADQTGGDIYDVAPLGVGRCAFLVGDATGHGIGPALSVTQVRAMLRMALRLDASLATAVAHVNGQLAADLPADRFVTAVVGVLDAATGTVSYIAAGQAPLLHYHAGTRQVTSLRASAPPLGVVDPLPALKPEHLVLAPGDMLALFTDGFFEARAPGGVFFDESRVHAWLRDHASQPLPEIIAGLCATVDRFRDGAPQADDMTALLIRRRAEAAEAPRASRRDRRDRRDTPA